MKGWIKRHGRAAGAAGSAALAAASLLVPAGLPARWAASALLILALPVAWEEIAPRVWHLASGRTTRLVERSLEYLPYAIVAIGALVSLGPISLGEMPISQDHANHYLATHILVNDMIPSGRFFGWTDRIGTGYPFGDLYPTPCYLVTGFLSIVSFGIVPLGASYAFGIVLVWTIPALATAAWARRISGPWGAALAGLACVVDVGSDREGGWTYSMFHGVWPQLLGVGAWLLALLALWRLAEKGTTRRLAAAALAGGLCLWIHPMNAPVLLASGAILVAVRLFGAPRDTPPGADCGAIRTIGALALAGVIGLVWVARMMLAGDSVSAYPVYWEPLSTLMLRLVDGGPFDHQLAIVAVLAAIGAVQAIRIGGRFRTLTLALLALLLAVGSMDLVVGADLGLAGGKIGVMQFRRFSIPAKPLWWALAGAGLTAIGRGIAAGLGDRNRAVRPIGLRILAAVLLAPCAWALACGLPGLIRSPSGRPLTMESAGEAAHAAAIRRVLDREGEDLALKRAVYWEKPGHGGRYPMFPMADAGFGFLSTKIIPANNYEHVNWTTDPARMARLGVSVVVSRWEHEHGALEEVATHGTHRVYRVKGQRDDQVEMRGAGSARVVSWEPEERRIEISDAGASSSLVVYQPPYRKWRAEQGGRDLEIVPWKSGGQTFSRVIGARDGEVALFFEDGWIERVVSALGIVALLACVAALIARPRLLPRPLGDTAAATVHRILCWCLAGLSATAIVAAAWGGAAAVDREWLNGEPPGARVLSVLHRQGHSSFEISPEEHCVAPHTRDPGWGCSESDLEPVLRPASKRRGKIPSCLEVGVPPRGNAELGFELPSGADRVSGRLHAVSGASVTAAATFDASGERVSLAGPRRGGSRFGAAVPDGADRIIFHFENEGARPSHVCVEAAALSGGNR